VGLGLSGRARLSRDTSPTAWRNSELDLNIENERAEVVEAEVRIERGKKVLQHTSRISFASGPARGFSLRLRRASSKGQRATGDGDQPTGWWPLGVQLDVLVSMQDRFGNAVPLDRSLSESLALRCNYFEGIDLTPRDGSLRFGATSTGVATLRGLKAGTVELWLDRIGGNSSMQERREFKSQTMLVVTFTDPAEPTAVMPSPPRAESLSPADARWMKQAANVRNEFLHAWRGYRRYAWGRDELEPVAKRGKDTFGGIGATVIDSLTTLWLMGLQEEFSEAADFVRDSLDFGLADEQVSVFELTIRGLGGLLGAHTLSGEQVFLDRARELGERLLRAFNTSSRLPMPKCNIAKGKCAPSTEPTILAEAGSVQLELRCLSDQTGDPRFRDAGDAAFQAIQSGGMTGLLPVYLTPPQHTPVKIISSKFALGALADSYYEYLLKMWLQSPGEERLKDLWLTVMDELPGMVRPTPVLTASRSVPKYKLIEVAPGGDVIWKMDHLSCFAPAMTALGVMTLPERDLALKDRNQTWLRLAEGMTAACVELWTRTKSGLAPEYIRVSSTPPHDYVPEIPSGARHSFLRPETAESLFYLYRLTGDEQYRRWGAQLFDAIVRNSKVDAGYSSVKDVEHVPTRKLDDMQSFVLAETFKYLYLLFSPAETLDLRRYVLNTEGHPLPKYRR
jgi:mannosyl-oligosaccharide alpha-1,2-mannosidase